MSLQTNSEYALIKVLPTNDDEVFLKEDKMEKVNKLDLSPSQKVIFDQLSEAYQQRFQRESRSLQEKR